MGHGGGGHGGGGHGGGGHGGGGHGGGGHIGGGGHGGGGHVGGGGHIGGGGHGGGGHPGGNFGGPHHPGGPHPGFNGPHHHPGYGGYGGYSRPWGRWGWGYGGPTVVVAGGGYNTYPADQVYVTNGSYIPPQVVPAQPDDPVCCNCCCLPPSKCMQLCAVVFLVHGIYLIGIDVLDFITVNISDTYIYGSILESIYGLLEVIFCVVCLMALSKKEAQPNTLSTYFIWRFFSVIASFAFLFYFYANNYVWEDTLTTLYFLLQVITSIWKIPAAVIASRVRTYPVLVWPAPIQSAPTAAQGTQPTQQQFPQGQQPIQQQFPQGPQPTQQQFPQGQQPIQQQFSQPSAPYGNFQSAEKPSNDLPPKYEDGPPPPNPYMASSQTGQPGNAASPTIYPIQRTQP